MQNSRRAHPNLAAALVLHLDVPFALRAERSLALYGSFGAEARLGERFPSSTGKVHSFMVQSFVSSMASHSQARHFVMRSHMAQYLRFLSVAFARAVFPYRFIKSNCRQCCRICLAGPLLGSRATRQANEARHIVHALSDRCRHVACRQLQLTDVFEEFPPPHGPLPHEPASAEAAAGSTPGGV